MEELMGKDLAEWRVETWYELRLPNDGCGHTVGGYFTDKDLAIVHGRGKASYGSDGKLAKVLVLTKDGMSGFIVEDKQINLSDQNAIRLEETVKTKSRLTEEERKLLGLE